MKMFVLAALSAWLFLGLILWIGCAEEERRIVVDVSGVDSLHESAYGDYELARIDAVSWNGRLRVYKPWEVVGTLSIRRNDTLVWKYTEGLLEQTHAGRFEIHSGLLVIFTDEDHVFAALKYRFFEGTMFLVYWNIQSRRELTFVYTKTAS